MWFVSVYAASHGVHACNAARVMNSDRTAVCCFLQADERGGSLNFTPGALVGYQDAPRRQTGVLRAHNYLADQMKSVFFQSNVTGYTKDDARPVMLTLHAVSRTDWHSSVIFL